MLDKLKDVENRYQEISLKLTDPSVIADNEQYRSLMREYKNLTPIVEKYQEYRRASDAHAEAKELLAEGGLDKELHEMAQEQLLTSREEEERCAEELKILLLPRDPNDEKNVIVEIRGGPLCQLPVPDVQHVRRAAGLEIRGVKRQRDRAGGIQGNQLLHRRGGCLLSAEV